MHSFFDYLCTNYFYGNDIYVNYLYDKEIYFIWNSRYCDGNRSC